MSDDPENLPLIYLRRIDARLERLEHKLDDVVTRQGFLERRVADMGVELAHLSTRFDRLETRIERIERRLDIVPA